MSRPGASVGLASVDLARDRDEASESGATDEPSDEPPESRPRARQRERAHEADWLLAQRVLGGDPGAASALYERCVRAVAATALRVLGRRGAELEDAAQAAFEQLMRSLDRYEGRCSLPTWASQIAAHTGLNVIRARRRERLVFDDRAQQGEEVSPGLDPEMSAELNAALSQLGPEKARVVVLHDLLGLGINEVAARVGVTVPAAQSRLLRARRELRSLLGAEGADDPSDEPRSNAA